MKVFAYIIAFGLISWGGWIITPPGWGFMYPGEKDFWTFISTLGAFFIAISAVLAFNVSGYVTLSGPLSEGEVSYNRANDQVLVIIVVAIITTPIAMLFDWVFNISEHNYGTNSLFTLFITVSDI